MGNKCCAAHAKRKISNFPTDSHLMQSTKPTSLHQPRPLNSPQKENYYQRFASEQKSHGDHTNMSMNQYQSEQHLSPEKKKDDRLPASPSSQKKHERQMSQKYHTSKTLQVPTRNSQRRKQNISGNQDEEDREKTQEIDIPKLRPSITIDVSKDWIPDHKEKADSDDMFVDFGTAAHNSIIRKQSTIHQISGKLSGSPPKSLFYHQNTLTLNPTGFEYTLQKGKLSGRSKNSNIHKHDSLTSKQFSAIDDEMESDDNTFSRANSLQQQELVKQHTMRSQGKSTARFKIQPISMALSSQNSLSPNEAARVSFGIKDQAHMFVKQQTSQFNQDSFDRGDSHIKEFDEISQNRDMHKSNDHNHEGNFQGFIFGKNGGSPNEDEISEFNEDINSPVLGKFKSHKQDEEGTLTINQVNNPDYLTKAHVHENITVEDQDSSNKNLRISTIFPTGSVTNKDNQEIEYILEQLVPTPQKRAFQNYNFSVGASQNYLYPTSQSCDKRVLFEPIREERETPSTKKHRDTPQKTEQSPASSKAQVYNPSQTSHIKRDSLLSGKDYISNKENSSDFQAITISPICNKSNGFNICSPKDFQVSLPPQSEKSRDENSSLTRSRDLLRPIKSLSKKLGYNYDQIETLIQQRRENQLRQELEKIQYQSSETSFRTSPKSNPHRSASQNPVNQAIQGEQTRFFLRESITSPPMFHRQKTQDLSVLGETIEISEDLIACGTVTDDGTSDMSNTPVSDNRNISQYLKSDNSINYSVIDVEYDANSGKNKRNISASTQNLVLLKQQMSEDIKPNTSRQGQVPPIIKRPFFKTHSNDNNQISTGVKSSNLQSLTSDNLSRLDDIQSKSNITKSVISTSKERDGKKKINQYIVVKTIGIGSFGKVKLALNTEENNKPYAMKIMSKKKLKRIFVGKNRTALQDVMQEIAIMKKLDHENVVKLHEVLDDPQCDKLYIIMEYVKSGSLMQKLAKSKTLQPHNLWKYFRDMITGLYYLHECAGIIHRDIKPENMLVDDNDKIKITDFGVSYIIENGADDIIQSTAGSNYFFAPEICSGVAYKGKKSDVWAAGVTLYFMMFKKYPFTASNIPALYNKIIHEEPDFPADSNQLLVQFLKRIFVKDPDQRITLHEIIQHDWITSNGIQPLPILLSPAIELSATDKERAINKVQLIAKIKLKIRQKVQQQKTQKLNNDKKRDSSPLLKNMAPSMLTQSTQ